MVYCVDSKTDQTLVENDIPLKKPKTELEVTMENEIDRCQCLLDNDEISLTEKLQSFINLFNSIVKNNVNTFLLKDDFSGFVQVILNRIISNCSEASADFLTFLHSTLEVAPTTFEPVIEKIFAIVFFAKGDKSIEFEYGRFMKKLFSTFERLRRFPKLIAKMLCSLRSQKTSDFTFNSLFSQEIVHNMESIFTTLPGAQIIDLWKMFHHNLENECVKPVINNEGIVQILFDFNYFGTIVMFFLGIITLSLYPRLQFHSAFHGNCITTILQIFMQHKNNRLFDTEKYHRKSN